MSTAQQVDTSSPLLELCINKAVHVGVEVRTRTQINRGAVSIVAGSSVFGSGDPARTIKEMFEIAGATVD